jgi:hypothetical protein
MRGVTAQHLTPFRDGQRALKGGNTDSPARRRARPEPLDRGPPQRPLENFQITGAQAHENLYAKPHTLEWSP